jgi:hypothetical protein
MDASVAARPSWQMMDSNSMSLIFGGSDGAFVKVIRPSDEQSSRVWNEAILDRPLPLRHRQKSAYIFASVKLRVRSYTSNL